MAEEEHFEKIYSEKEKRNAEEKLKKGIERRNGKYKNYSRPDREYMQKDPYRDSDGKEKK